MDKSKILKILVLCLVFTIIISMSLYACKTPEEKTTTETEATSTEETTAVEETAKVSGVKAPEKEVTIDYWWQDWAGGTAWMKEWIPVFEEKYPTIKINLIPLPFEELNTKIFPSIAAGNEADVMMLYDEWLLDKDPSKVFGPITPQLYTIEDISKICFASALGRVTGSDGEVYGAPICTGANAAGILIHKDLFDEAGIDPSTIKTWDDVKEAAKALTKYKADGSIERSGILFTYTETANLFLDVIAAQGAGGKLLNSETGEWNFNIPEAKNSLELLKWFVDEKLSDPASGDPFTSFPNKLGAMLLIGPWALGAWGEQYPDLKLDYIPMPKYPGTDKNVHTVVSWATLAVSKRLEGDKRNAALLYIKEVLENPEFFNIPFTKGYWVGVPGSQPYLEYVTELSKEGKAPTRQAEIAANVASSYVPSINLLPTKISEPELIRTIIYPELENVFLGRKTVDEALSYLTNTLTAKEQEKM
ncbi:MAG: extracellular solute-binding protein [Actinobacteria bacterium]|nr:extracellular solute-binding protein [Actinomycetota bacterium]